MEMNMNASRDDALALLSKLKNERASIVLTVLSSSCKLSIAGIVSECSAAEFCVTPIGPDNKSFVCIDLSHAQKFDYSDSREAPPEVPEGAKGVVAGVLYFQLPHGAAVAVFEVISDISNADET
jgi:hypothetical protein